MKVYAPFPHKSFFQLKIVPSCSDPDVLATPCCEDHFTGDEALRQWSLHNLYTAGLEDDFGLLTSPPQKKNREKAVTSWHSTWGPVKRGFQCFKPTFMQTLGLQSKSKITDSVYPFSSRTQPGLNGNHSRAVRKWSEIVPGTELPGEGSHNVRMSPSCLSSFRFTWSHSRLHQLQSPSHVNKRPFFFLKAIFITNKLCVKLEQDYLSLASHRKTRTMVDNLGDYTAQFS